ncbi:hypothetical protein FBU59_000972 [Linderina macrospora]|uniref:Uncharacterized protein n=1 Tax=Linderina macrospora TaxID=4868 RepID=A0ACC1JF62_9FUNG|nr:hypothetical protein FBU59_000972 [Linderina macrospora]
MTKYQVFTANAFTDKQFCGNPAAVVLAPDDSPLSESQLLQIAAELNLSETAFIVPKNASGPNAFQEASQFGLRWFTPTTEVSLCGHATLATSFVVLEKLDNKSTELSFDTLSGKLVVRRGQDGRLDMTLPINPPRPVAITEDIKLLVTSIYGEFRDSVEVELSPTLNYLVVHDPSTTRDDVASSVPRFSREAYTAGERLNLIAILVTAKGTDKDFHSRVFGPWVGALEDPVCGSAHTVLAPFWQSRLEKRSFSATQVSKRHGDLKVDIISGTHIRISGRAVAVLEGMLTV